MHMKVGICQAGSELCSSAHLKSTFRRAFCRPLKNNSSFWSMVKNILTNISGQKINSDPYLFLLTMVDSDLFSPSMASVLTHIIVAARIVCAQHWKSPDVPSEEMLFQKNT